MNSIIPLYYCGNIMTFLILLQAFFATSFPLGKYLLAFVSPMFLSGIRMLISGAILLVYQYFLPSGEFKFKKEHFWTFVQIIVLGMYMTYGLRLYALRELPVWKTSFFYNFYLEKNYQKNSGLALPLVCWV
jgi:drug/metabolite transporter (DMT)-like permease